MSKQNLNQPSLYTRYLADTAPFWRVDQWKGGGWTEGWEDGDRWGGFVAQAKFSQVAPLNSITLWLLRLILPCSLEKSRLFTLLRACSFYNKLIYETTVTVAKASLGRKRSVPPPCSSQYISPVHTALKHVFYTVRVSLTTRGTEWKTKERWLSWFSHILRDHPEILYALVTTALSGWIRADCGF